MADKSRIRLNQVGFLPEASKIAVVPNVEVGEFWLIQAESNTEVLRGPLSQSQSWDMSGDTVKIADFSAYNKPGRYKIRVTGAGDSQHFTSGEKVYDELDRVRERKAAIGQTRGGKDSPEYKRLAAREKELMEKVGSLKIARGDADSKEKPKARKRGSSSGVWGGSSSGSSGSSSSSSGVWGN